MTTNATALSENHWVCRPEWVRAKAPVVGRFE